MLSIIVPTTGNLSSLQRLLHSINSQEASEPVEVLVVCNPPQPELMKTLVCKFPMFLLECERGANRARNMGIERAKGNILLFLDDDCEFLDPLFFQKHLDNHKKYPEIVGIGSNYLLPPTANSFDRTYFQIQQYWLKNGTMPGFYDDLILGGNFSVKKEGLGEVRFDPDLVYGGTETDLVFRLVGNGKKVRFLDAPQLLHHTRLNLYSLCKKAYLQGVGARLLREKDFHSVRTSSKGGLQREVHLWSKLYDGYFHLGFSGSRDQRFGYLTFITSACYLIPAAAARVLQVFLFSFLWNALEVSLFAKRK